jgi:archaellum biogenesis ATPase FlaH
MQETVSREEQMKGIETMVQLRSHTSPEINVRKVVEDVVNNTIRTGTIVGMPVNQMAESVRDTPEPINLFMGIWHQKEVCILYGDSGCGKSILSANNILYHITELGYRGLYFDLELTKEEFAMRMKDSNGILHQFPATYIRADENTDDDLDELDDRHYESAMLQYIEEQALKQQADVIVIDNISYICMDSEKPAEAGRIMRRLNHLKNKHGWSILVIAHTPKIDEHSMLSKNHLAGSKRLSNFTQVMMAMGRSARNPNLRYLKPIKVRSRPEGLAYGEVYELELTRDPFLHFEFIGIGKETDHLPPRDAPQPSSAPKTSEDRLLEWMSDGNEYSRQGILLMAVQNQVNGNTMMSALQRLVVKGLIIKENDAYRVAH